MQRLPPGQRKTRPKSSEKPSKMVPDAPKYVNATRTTTSKGSNHHPARIPQAEACGKRGAIKQIIHISIYVYFFIHGTCVYVC